MSVESSSLNPRNNNDTMVSYGTFEPTPKKRAGAGRRAMRAIANAASSAASAVLRAKSAMASGINPGSQFEQL